VRKLFAIVLCASLLVLLTGHGWILRYYMREAKAQMKATLRRQADHPDLTTFRFDAAELDRLTWEEDGKEFLYKGVMYDVVTRIAEGGITEIHCIADHKETELARQWENWNRKNSGHSGSLSLVKLLYGWEHTRPPQLSITAYTPLPIIHFPYSDRRVVDRNLEILRPPGSFGFLMFI
jgi:hypothetical protein